MNRSRKFKSNELEGMGPCYLLILGFPVFFDPKESRIIKWFKVWEGGIKAQLKSLPVMLTSLLGTL